MFGPVTSPLPLRATLCGLPMALSEMDREAERGPTWPGVKLTLTVQCAPLARVELQLFVSPKSLGFVPVKLIPAMFKDTGPLLVTVTGCEALVVVNAWPPKSRLATDRVTVAVCNAIVTVVVPWFGTARSKRPS